MNKRRFLKATQGKLPIPKKIRQNRYIESPLETGVGRGSPMLTISGWAWKYNAGEKKIEFTLTESVIRWNHTYRFITRFNYSTGPIELPPSLYNVIV